MTIEYIQKKKLCPFMSDGREKVYCSPECGFVIENYSATDQRDLIGLTCGLFSTDEKLDAILEKMELLIDK